MVDKKIGINRTDLYEQVWSTPMTQLASQYSMSDNGLKKICRKLNIPTPPIGYWARLQHGKKGFKKPLHDLKYGEQETYTLEVKQTTKRYLEDDSKIIAIIAEEEKADRISVAEKLVSPHPLVELTRDVLSKAKPDDYGALRLWRQKYLDMRVTPGTLKRALRIMDALVKAFEERNFKVDIVTDKVPESYALIHGEKLSFSIEEKINQIAHVPTEKEKKELEKYPWKARKWDYIPTGILTLRIKEYGPEGLRKSWSDGKSKRLEDLLNDFIVGAIKVAIINREERLIREKESEERRKREEEELRHRLAMEKFIRKLENNAESWAKSQMIRSYINEVEKIVAQRDDSHTFQEQYEKWLVLAKRYADHLDPLQKEMSFDNDYMLSK
jgi:hypothetical protein